VAGSVRSAGGDWTEACDMIIIAAYNNQPFFADIGYSILQAITSWLFF
jgi:hypothetical protein